MEPVITSVKEQFDAWKKEASKTLSKVKKEMDNAIEPFQRNLKMNTITNIPEDFGKFLYSCLGDRVTGQRSSVLNKTFFEKNDHGKQIAEKAKEKKVSIEVYLQKHDYHENWNKQKIWNQTQGLITAGRRFGVSYYTGEDRTHTIYFEEGKIFENLTQEHVECVKNSLKKECTQAFLDYRNEFLKGISTMNDNNIITLNMPVKLVKVVTLTTQTRYGSDGYDYDKSLQAVVVEEIKDGVVGYATIEVPQFSIWEREHNVNSRDARRGTTVVMPFLSIRFGSVTGGKTTNPPVETIEFGNVDISANEFSHTFNTLDNDGASVISSTNLTRSCQPFHSVFNKIEEKNRYYARRSGKESDSIILNMVDVFQHPDLVKAIDSRINFFVSESVKLQDLKHKFAGLYFLNE